MGRASRGIDNNSPIKRGRGRPRKQAQGQEFVSLKLGEESMAMSEGFGQLILEWTRAQDGARLRVVVSEGSAMKFVRAFLGGEL